MNVYCGIDWAERHHDVALVDDTGTQLAKKRITDDAAGYRELLDLLAEHGDTPEDLIPIAIETSHGLLVAALRTGNRQIYAINPLSAARYRDRHGVSRKKSDPGDALVLANILRTDMHAHRPLPADSDLARAITVLARAQQDAVWHRQQLVNQVRSLLKTFYPAALDAFQGKQHGLARPEARDRLGHGTDPGPRREALAPATPGRAAACRPRPRHRSRGPAPQGGLPRRLRSPTAGRRGCHGAATGRPHRPVGRRLSGGRRARQGGGGVFSQAPGR